MDAFSCTEVNCGQTETVHSYLVKMGKLDLWCRAVSQMNTSCVYLRGTVCDVVLSTHGTVCGVLLPTHGTVCDMLLPTSW